MGRMRRQSEPSQFLTINRGDLLSKRLMVWSGLVWSLQVLCCHASIRTLGNDSFRSMQVDILVTAGAAI